MNLLQLIPLFTTGFIVSRIVARTSLAKRLVLVFAAVARGRVSIMLLAVMASAAVLSLFIPNLLTVLVLLPALEKLREAVAESGEDVKPLTTPLVLALIYGANTGGMGSLVGSPANALMLGALELYQVPSREAVGFLSWLLWGVPLVAGFLLTSWLVLVTLLVPRRYRTRKLQIRLAGLPPPARYELFGKWVGIGSAAFWIGLSTAGTLYPHLADCWNTASILFGLVFILFVFGFAITEEDGKSRPLLRLSDTYSKLPLRGIVFALLAAGVSFLLVLLKLDLRAARQVTLLFPGGLEPFRFNLILVWVTIFATEVFSNTATSVALFPIANTISLAMGLHPLPAMMGVALASTCAFMSPLATPVNGLAFGGVRGVSLARMLCTGLLVNVLGGLWLSFFLTVIIPSVYGISLYMPPGLGY